MTKAMMDDPRRFKEENPFESMMERFDRAAQLLNLNPDLYAVMRVPNRELKVYIPVRMDSGRIEVFEGYRVQHNFARGPAKGGIRYAPDVTIERLRAVDTGEAVMRELGFREFRVRHHDELVRLEVAPAELDRALRREVADELARRFRALGFRYVTLDLHGYRTGAMNEILKNRELGVGSRKSE